MADVDVPEAGVAAAGDEVDGCGIAQEPATGAEEPGAGVGAGDEAAVVGVAYEASELEL